MARPGYEADRFRIVLDDWADGTRTGADRGVGPLAAGHRLVGRRKTIYANAANLGQVSLFAIDVAQRQGAGTVVEQGTVRSPSESERTDLSSAWTT